MGNENSAERSERHSRQMRQRRSEPQRRQPEYEYYEDTDLDDELRMGFTTPFRVEQGRIYNQVQREQERRQAVETRARQQNAQAMAAVQVQTRMRLQAEASRIQAEEMRRKAEEDRARVEAQLRQTRLEQQISRTVQESGRLEQGETMGQSAITSLPQVCRRHNTRQGCSETNCRRLHICRLFLADICKYGVACRHVHSLTTVHNQAVCNQYNLDTARELQLLQKLRLAFDANDVLPETFYVNNLERCFRFGSKRPCCESDCKRIHICRQYVAGVCRQTNCSVGHDLHTTHNNGVLSQHRLTKMADSDIIEILRGKENKEPQKANRPPAPASSAMNGAVPRRHPAGAGGQDSANGGQSGNPAPVGISEELQCPICLEMFRRATTLGCGHTFCAECLQEARGSNGDKCPMCRAHISSAIRSVTLDNIIRSMTTKQ